MTYMKSCAPIAAAIALAAFPAAANKGGEDAALKQAAEATLAKCSAISDSCQRATDAAAGVLVFPEVVSASLVIGGTGSKGVLYVDDQFAGFYGLGEGSVGFQAGVEKSSQVFALDATALEALRGEGTWKIGADAKITVVAEGATAQGVSGTGHTEVFVFDEKGLHAGAAVRGLTIFALDEDLERRAATED
jgi:lipid-binding SYLF domain-containing protein